MEGGKVVDAGFRRLHSAIGGLANRRLPVYGVVKGDAMIAKVTSNRQIALGIIGNMALRSEQGENKYGPQPA